MLTESEFQTNFGFCRIAQAYISQPCETDLLRQIVTLLPNKATLFKSDRYPDHFALMTTAMKLAIERNLFAGYAFAKTLS